MADWRLAILGSWALLAAACSSGMGADSSATAPCASGFVTFTGEIGGQAVSVMVRETSGQFQQATVPYTLDVTYDGGQLHLEWTTTFPFDAPPTPATGTVVLPASAPHAGETICFATGTIREREPPADAGRFEVDTLFTMGSLSLGPSCPGAPIAGASALNGCESF
jgi:hypothetical protein